jgi:glycosyltransferase involved in cell wall biosynthesis
MIVDYTPVFSVIIPLYNSEEYIGNTIHSVLNQTYDSWELIVVDDCSTDNSNAIVREIMNNDSRIKLIVSEENFGGPAKPRNIGIKASRGKYIAFLDSDDVWYENKLEVCLNHLNDNVDVVYHDLNIFGKVNFFSRKKLSSRALTKPALIDFLTQGNAIPNSSAVVRKEILEQINYIDELPGMIASEDYNTWLKIAKISESFIYLNKALGKYLIGEYNISSKDMSVSARNASKEFLKFLNEEQLIKYETHMDYIRGRYIYLNKDCNSPLEPLFKVFHNGSFRLRIRSLYMLAYIYIRRTIFKQTLS